MTSMAFSGCVSEEWVGEKQSVESRPSTSISSKVYVIKTRDREYGVNELMNYAESDLSSKKVAIKANYNSADEFPASTHIETLSAIVDFLKIGDNEIILAERSGMGDTSNVLKETGVMSLSKEKDFEVVVLDELKIEDWIEVNPADSHWKRGFLFPKVFREADAIIQTCCLKTHRYGGHFTMSLKNSVGMIAKYHPKDGYNYMSELHTSPNQRKMIAEINTIYESDYVIMDAIKGFSKGGPDTGTLIEPGLMLASKDRVALDAAGVAILRIFGTTSEVSRGDIFGQEQIARAIELGLGAFSPENIEIIPVNGEASEVCLQIEDKLMEGYF
ncbi:MAG TPA: DUF362 domain-containing protein [Archaeoglobaceae archaeon]|nr:DUF362 domain-containing protein [Archaeoglobaceae archaeon]